MTHRRFARRPSMVTRRPHLAFLSVVVVGALSIGSEAVAEDCVPPTPSLEQLGVLDAETRLCPVVVYGTAVDGPASTKGDSEGLTPRMFTARVTDDRACDGVEVVRLVSIPTLWDAAPNWQEGQALWVVSKLNQPVYEAHTDVPEAGARPARILDVRLRSGCSGDIDHVWFEGSAPWGEEGVPDDFVVLKAHLPPAPKSEAVPRGRKVQPSAPPEDSGSPDALAYQPFGVGDEDTDEHGADEAEVPPSVVHDPSKYGPDPDAYGLPPGPYVEFAGAPYHTWIRVSMAQAHSWSFAAILEARGGVEMKGDEAVPEKKGDETVPEKKKVP